jgi:hypothetical protein
MDMHVRAGDEHAQVNLSNASQNTKLRAANWVSMGTLVLSAPLTVAWIGLIAWSLVYLMGWIVE